MFVGSLFVCVSSVISWFAHFTLLRVVKCLFLFFFFFKQKTAYEMRISDWSSDVCSSDLLVLGVRFRPGRQGETVETAGLSEIIDDIRGKAEGLQMVLPIRVLPLDGIDDAAQFRQIGRAHV